MTEYISITHTNLLMLFSEIIGTCENHMKYKHMCEQRKVLVVTAVSKYRTELQYEYHTFVILECDISLMSVKGKKKPL
jgi:hypothetical protein